MFTVVAFIVGALLTHINNRIKYNNRIQYFIEALGEQKYLLNTLKDSQTAQQIEIKTLMIDSNNSRELLKGTQKSLNALTLAIISKFPELDYKLFLSLNGIDELSLKDALIVAKEVKKREAVIKNLGKYSFDDRVKMAHKFIKDIKKYDLQNLNETKLAESLFYTDYGVGGGED